jgi:hypothetical protein
MKNIIKYLTVTAAAAACAATASASPTPSGAALELISGATTIIIQDGSGSDISPLTGSVGWVGSINGWAVVITSGLTKPIQGSVTGPDMDLSVQASAGGAGSLTIEFTDTGFGPVTGGVNHQFSGNIGSSVVTSAGYYDAGNGQFATTTPLGGSINLAGPFSFTLVDTFTPGSVSTDDNLTVPDGGTTVMLLGAALSGLGFLRKKLAA